MSRTVLCTVDITRPDEQRHLLTVAAQQAALDDAQLDVITVVPDFGSSMVGAYFQAHDIETARDRAGEGLTKLVKDVLGDERNKTVRHIVAQGSVYHEVLKTATLNNADLIVIGAHRPDFKDFLLGPNAARIVRHANCSVYVVR